MRTTPNLRSRRCGAEVIGAVIHYVQSLRHPVIVIVGLDPVTDEDHVESLNDVLQYLQNVANPSGNVPVYSGRRVISIPQQGRTI